MDKSDFLVEQLNVPEITRPHFADAVYNAYLRRGQQEGAVSADAAAQGLSAMSHDLRTPVNAIIGFAELARQTPGNGAAVADCLEKIIVSADRLLNRIDNILEMNHLSHGQMDVCETELELAGLLGDLIATERAQAQAEEIALTLDTAGIAHGGVYGDGKRISQALLNIVDNAVKFTPPGGQVRVSVQEEPSDRSGYATYVFCVEDSGEGMSPALLELLFSPNGQAERAEFVDSGGSGLGIPIARHIVSSLGGTLSAESEVEVGSAFTIVLTLRQRALPQAEETVDYTGQQALLVEDIALNAQIAGAYMRKLGFTVQIARNGQEGLDAFAQSPVGHFAVVMMDLQMPVMNGFEATAAIRALARGDAATVPIIAMSANSFEEDKEKARRVGMNDHLGKPFKTKDFRAILARHVPQTAAR